jgi:tRNA pseudouridine13 synthase
MKLKRTSEDFQVEERVSLSAGGGRFALYRLTKQSLGTPEAIGAIARRWNLRREQIAFAGLKDKHALTRQFVTIAGGPRRNLSQENLALEYLGQTARPIHASDITANGFVVVLRDLADAAIPDLVEALQSAAEFGVPNYFDNQRFGSLGQSGEFVAEPWCRGDYERTLWLALAEPQARDRPRERDEKQLLREAWGDWRRARQELPPGDRQRVAALLAMHEGDYRRAIGLLRQDLRSLWLAAYQSHLWNQILAAALHEICRAEQLHSIEIGRRELPFFKRLDTDQAISLRATDLPLPSARLHLPPGPLADLYDRVLAAEGTALREIRVKYPRDSFFSKGQRAAVFVPQEVATEAADDDLYPGRKKLTLRFALPRGCYATILIKALTGGLEDELAEDDAETR